MMKRTAVAIAAASLFSTLALAQGNSGKDMKPAPAAAAKDMKAGEKGAEMKADPKAGEMKAGAPAGMGDMDMSKVGPWSRKPKDEKAVKKEIDAFFKEEEALMKKGDFEAGLARIDFPVFMITDDAKGTVESKAYSKEEYAAMMKPMVEAMPKEMTWKHKYTTTVLSDALVTVTDDFTQQLGKMKNTGRSHSFLVKKNGKWMWKVMAEAGWGGMGPGTGGSGEMK